jgi:hypothetical protein
LTVTAPDRVFAPVEVMKVPVDAAKVFAALPDAVRPVEMTGETNVLLDSDSEPARVPTVPVVGRVTFVAPVLVRVILLAPLVARVLLSASVSVPVVVVIVRPFRDVAVATPSAGVVKVAPVIVGEVSVLLVNVSVPVRVAMVRPLTAGPVTVTPSGIVNVPVEEVMVRPLTVVPVMVPDVIVAFFNALATVTFLDTCESEISKYSDPSRVVLAG